MHRHVRPPNIFERYANAHFRYDKTYRGQFLYRQIKALVQRGIKIVAMIRRHLISCQLMFYQGYCISDEFIFNYYIDQFIF